ncbi:MAG: hypothetical protein IPL19_26790 [Sandaracinaceae bacterium]|nr:hypothetical protein [Sandaracinaceae bacterium]
MLALAMLMGRAVVATRATRISSTTRTTGSTWCSSSKAMRWRYERLSSTSTPTMRNENVVRAARERRLRDFDVRQMAAAMMAAIHAD